VTHGGPETCITFGDVNGVGLETELATGAEVLVIIPGDENVIFKLTARGRCAGDDSEPRRYLLDVPDRDPFIGIGVIGRPRVHISPDATIAADIDRDGAPEVFKACTSSEGVHLTIWSGAERRWHAYHYLGYDVEPSCTEGETRP
jgi:hypothetical protein